jgi:hypothetical protein
VLPLITEVEYVGELLADSQLRELDSPVVQQARGMLVLMAGSTEL